MTEINSPAEVPIVITISAKVPLEILRVRDGFVVNVGDFVQIRGVTDDHVADAGATFVDGYVPGDPFRTLVDAAQSVFRRIRWPA